MRYYASRIHIRNRNVTVWHPSVCPSVCLSVCPVGLFTVTHQVTACDAASVHFCQTIRRTDIPVLVEKPTFLSTLTVYERKNVK